MTGVRREIANSVATIRYEKANKGGKKDKNLICLGNTHYSHFYKPLFIYLITTSTIIITDILNVPDKTGIKFYLLSSVMHPYI